MTTYANSSFVAILLLSGSGGRFGGGVPKQFHNLSGKKVYLHTLEKFLSVGVFREIILVTHPQFIKAVTLDIEAYKNKNIHVVSGGSTRQESSLQGLLECSPNTDFVTIHDAVRPFVSQEIILDNVRKVVEYHAVDTCIPSADTIVHVASDGFIKDIPNRSSYWRGQTPQSFEYSLILQAHRNACERGMKNISDDCRLVIEEGCPVHVALGSEENIKITTELDLFIAEQLYRTHRDVLTSSQEIKGHQPLKDKRFVLIGGPAGIGEAVCDQLRREGAVAIPLSRRSLQYSLDIRDPQAVERVFAQIHVDIGPIDGLINSAGILKMQDLQGLTFADIQNLISTNLSGVIYSCKCAQIKPGGHIVNMASSSFVRGRKNYALYSCAKAAVVNLTQALAEELQGLRVNVIVPQRTRTQMRSWNFPHDEDHSLLSPQEVALQIITLLKSSHLTGAIVDVRKFP